jgi:flagellar hook protein FlgE
MAISGEGYFEVKDPESEAVYLTRAGDFHIDDSGYLVTDGGYRVQGYSDSTLSTTGDIKIDSTGAENASATYSSFSLGTDGKITVTMSDNTTFVRGQVLLMSVTNPNALVNSGGNLYSNIDAAGPLGGAGSATLAASGTNGLGSFRWKSLEASNVDLAGEFANMITAQRGFQANARVITTSDEILQEVVGLKR